MLADARRFADAEMKMLEAGKAQEMYDSTFTDAVKGTPQGASWLKVLQVFSQRCVSATGSTFATQTDAGDAHRVAYHNPMQRQEGYFGPRCD